MSDLIRIKKGLDINLEGKAERNLSETKTSVFYAVKPTDFPGLTPKVIAKPGDEVKAGTPLFYDKYKPNVLFTSPVSGKISAINRGERRKILEFVVEADGKNQSEEFVKSNPNELSREVIKENLLKSGCWPYILQRPFAIIANPNDIPRDIFVTTFNSAPLAPDFDFVVKDDFENFQTGINALRKLTDGKIYLGIKAGQISSLYKTTANAEKVEFSGPHPVGNVGTQINKIKPVNKGEIVWTLNATEVIIIGRLFNKGIYDPTRIVAITGSEVIRPAYHKAISGIQIEKLVENNIKTTDGEIRYISGNVLTGEKVSPKNFLGFYDSQLTIIPEGNEPEFLGWGAPGFGKFSISRTFFSWLNKNKELKIDTNLRGGKRPFIVTGEFEKVFPLDILPMQLLKAIHVKDLDLMEELGIYEVAEEDFALCEVINTSKIEIQKLVREGFEFMIKELG
jgi:Na+-transporting NADH:ubiquinone oxidoreductase subunit A